MTEVLKGAHVVCGKGREGKEKVWDDLYLEGRVLLKDSTFLLRCLGGCV